MKLSLLLTVFLIYIYILKKYFASDGSIDRYDTDLGGQGTYHDGHKITFSLGP